MIVAAEHRLFRSVSNSAKTLTNQAEHVFRNLFRAHVALGAFTPTHGAEQNIPFPTVFRCFGLNANERAQWKIPRLQRPNPALFARNQLHRLIARQFSRNIKWLFAMCQRCAVAHSLFLSTSKCS